MSYWGTTKPPLGTSLDGGNALVANLKAAYIFAETSGTSCADSVTSGAASLVTHGATLGPGLPVPNAGDGAYVTTPAKIKINPPLTFFIRVRHTGTPDVNCDVALVSYNDTNGSPFNAYVFWYDGSRNLNFGWNDVTAFRTLVVGSNPSTGGSYWTAGGAITAGGTPTVLTYLNGAAGATTTTNAPNPSIAYSAVSQAVAGQPSWNSAANLRGVIDLVYVFNIALSAAQVASLDADPYQVFSGPSSATASVALGAMSAAGSGTFSTSASAAITLGETSASATGASGTTASVAVTLAPLSAAASGTFSTTAAAPITLGPMSAAGSGTFSTSASAAITLDPLSAAASGTFSTTAAAPIALGPMAAAGSGTSSTSASAAITLDPISAAGSGSSGTFASASPTLGAMAGDGTGTFDTAATADVALGPLSAVGAGTFSTAGAADVALAPLSASGDAFSGVFATAAITLGSIAVAGSGTFSTSGSADVALGSIVVVAAGTAAVVATAIGYSLPAECTLICIAQPDPLLCYSVPKAARLLVPNRS